jgi:tripartite-type tricarboxylate transporter receptor subunit TctC
MRRLVLATIALVIGLSVASAQGYPSRVITLIVPFPAGGPTDTLARIMAERMKTSLGQPVIVENVSGAGGSLGVTRVARSAPDGYTFVIGQLTAFVLSSAVYNVSYDLLGDFEPVALLTIAPQWLIARSALPVNNLKELIAWLKANPDKGSLGTVGVGSPSHVFGVHFQNQTGTRLSFVPYRGGAPALQDLVAGQIDLSMLEASSTLPSVREGRIKALAVLDKARWASAPDVPTADEAGIPGLHMPFWHGFWVPKGVPKEVIDKLHAAVVEAMKDPAVMQRLAVMGQQIPPPDQQTPAALGELHRAEMAKWVPVAKGANIKAE